MLWQIEQVSKQDHWAPEKQVCSINSVTLGFKFDYRTRASSNLPNFQAIFRHSTGIRRMYHFLAIFRQSDKDPTNVVVFLLHCQCTPKMATLQCTPYLPTWILRDSYRSPSLQCAACLRVSSRLSILRSALSRPCDINTPR